MADEKAVLAYQDRKDRSEGFYPKPLGFGSILTLRSLTRQVALEATLPKLVEIRCCTQEKKSVHLKLQPLKSNAYYRVEKTVNDPAIPFQWTTEVAKKSELSDCPWGFLAWLDPTEEPMYIPLDVLEASREFKPEAGKPAPYRFSIWTSKQLQEMYYSVRGIGASGVQKVFVQKTPLGRGLYPADRAVTLTVDAGTLGTPGSYDLVLTASTDSGTETSLVVRFTHGSPPK